MNNDERDRQLYKYPGTDVLRNTLGIRDQQQLTKVEARLVRVRLEQGAPKGNCDLPHLQAIHRHLFQDVYSWAGELRKVDFHKTDWFLPHSRIEMGMRDVHQRLMRQDYLQGLKRGEFAVEAGKIMGDVNYAHPFREGNGRTQLQYLKQLAQKAAHPINLTKLQREPWIEASIASNRGNYALMAKCIEGALVRERARSKFQDRDRGDQDRER